MTITDWPEDERPRARLLAQGTASRSDAEVLAILLRVDSRGRSAVDLARQPIARFGALRRLLAAGRVLAVLRTQVDPRVSGGGQSASVLERRDCGRSPRERGRRCRDGWPVR